MWHFHCEILAIGMTLVPLQNFKKIIKISKAFLPFSIDIVRT